MRQFKLLLKNKKEIGKKIEILELVIKSLTNDENISDKKRKLLARSFSSKIILKSEMEQLDAKILDIESGIKVENGRLKVRGCIHPNTSVIIGDAIYLVDEKIYDVIMENKQGEICVYKL